MIRWLWVLLLLLNLIFLQHKGCFLAQRVHEFALGEEILSSWAHRSGWHLSLCPITTRIVIIFILDYHHVGAEVNASITTPALQPVLNRRTTLLHRKLSTVALAARHRLRADDSSLLKVVARRWSNDASVLNRRMVGYFKLRAWSFAGSVMLMILLLSSQLRRCATRLRVTSSCWGPVTILCTIASCLVIDSIIVCRAGSYR